MDFIDIYRVSKNIFQVDTNDLKFLHVLKLLGYDGNLSEIPRCQPVRGYKGSLCYGEHIKLLFGGEHTKKF